jgi:hypothetical protein
LVAHEQICKAALAIMRRNRAVRIGGAVQVLSGSRWRRVNVYMLGDPNAVIKLCRKYLCERTGQDG